MAVTACPTGIAHTYMAAEALERGASLVTGGHRAPRHGSELFFEPTVLDGKAVK